MNSLIKITDFADVVTGGTPSTLKKEYWNGGDIPWLNSSELNNYVITTSNNFITKQGLKSSAARLMPPNTVLIALTGTTTGQTAILNIEACANQSVTGIMPSENHHPKYLYYYLSSIRKKVMNESYGGAQKHISQGYVKNIQVPLPPLETQKKIAEILDKADALRQQDKKIIGKYDLLTQSVFLDMFGDPVTNPKGWEEKEIGEICSEIVDCVNRTAPIVDYETEYKMIRTSNVRDYKIDLSETRCVTVETYMRWTRRMIPEIGDIVFTREAPVGEAGIIESNHKVFLGQRTMEYRPNQNLTNPHFLLYQLMGQDVQRQITRLGSGSTVKHLSVPDCKKFIIKCPPINLQNQFAEIVEKIEKQKRLAQKSLEKSEQLFQSLLQKAFKGELV